MLNQGWGYTIWLGKCESRTVKYGDGQGNYRKKKPVLRNKLHLRRAVVQGIVS